VRTSTMTDVTAHGRLIDDAAVIFLQPRNGHGREFVATARVLSAPRTVHSEPIEAEYHLLQAPEPNAAIIIDANGRLIQYNEAFVVLWSLTKKDLRGEPGIAGIAKLCAVRNGPDAIWEIIASAVASSEPERHADWGTQTRPDGREIALSILRLPDGNTFVEFINVAESTQAA